MTDEPFIFHPSAFTQFFVPPAGNGSGGKKFERMVRLRVRIRFCKQEDLRWIGHRDLMRCLERIFRRAALPLGMSEGFHPKPRMTFPLPWRSESPGRDEVMEFELAETLSAEEIRVRLAPQCPAGWRLRSVEVLPPEAKKAHVHSATYEAPIPAPLARRLGRADRALAGPPACPIARTARPFDGRPPPACCESCRFPTACWRCGCGSIKPAAPARATCWPRWTSPIWNRKGVTVTRTAVEIVT